MESTKKKLNIDILLNSKEYSIALNQIREIWKRTCDEYIHTKEKAIEIKNINNYDDEKDDEPNIKNEKETKKRRAKNTSGDKPKKKAKKRKGST